MGPRLGWLLLGAGVLLLYGYGIYDFMTDTSEPIWVRLALAGIGLGLPHLIPSRTSPASDCPKNRSLQRHSRVR